VTAHRIGTDDSGRKGRPALRNYAVVTAAYWADTVADGAIRMLVLFFFSSEGFSPFKVASLFVGYEIFGVITNLVGGWVAARFGLRTTLLGGLVAQLVALGMLGLAPPSLLVAPYVMVAQAIGGIAKDLTKMSAKSTVKLVAPSGTPGALYKWVAVLTGSKIALKGVGFFVGALLLTVVGFRSALGILAVLVAAALVMVLVVLRDGLDRPDAKAKFSQMFSHNQAVNVLAAARIFLFASRDVWFVIALPVFFEAHDHWSFYAAGGFLAIWTIGYGGVQALAPRLLKRRTAEGRDPDGSTATLLAFVLALLPALIALALQTGFSPVPSVVIGLLCFGVAFALNSAVHSYLILAYAEGDKVAMNVGFYYTANAGGRLAGTVLSGALYEWQGLEACLWVSTGCILVAAVLSRLLPDARGRRVAQPPGATRRRSLH
jgi:predicted MFS family arabinose efflux permease